MTTNQTVALTTLVGMVMITVSDAPNWQVEPYVGLLAAMVGVSVLGAASPSLAKSFSVLIGAVIVLQRGRKVAAVLERKVSK